VRANWIDNTSSTGGTGALTLSGVTGSPGYTDAFGTSGTRTVEYQALEYTDSTRAELVRAESGVGSIALSTGVLTRSLVTATWVASGASYLPKPGVATAPSALSFGTTAANIRIILAPVADGALPYGHNTGNSEGVLPFFFTGTAGPGTNNLTHQEIRYWYYPWLHNRRPISVVTIRMGATYTGGSSSYNLGIYAVGTDGFPAEQLADFGNLGSIVSGNISSGALTNPIQPPTGGFYVAELAQFSGGSGTPNILCSSAGVFTTPLGAALTWGGARHLNLCTKAAQTSLPATAVGTAPAGNQGQVPFFAFK
jgi:hypothetical protein